jgi:hypothetical protein
VLWEREAGTDGALAWPLGTDVDGDGTDDLGVEGLQVHTEEFVEECEEEDGEQWCWPVQYHATFTWTTGIASGADGSTLWTRTADGEIDEASTETSGSSPVVDEWGYRYELDSTNLYVFGLPAGDLDGDGADDLVIDEIDLDVAEAYQSRGAGPAWTTDASLQVRAATRADVVSAATGTVRQRLSDTAAGRISFLWPAPDMVGGPEPDLLWDRTIAPDQAVSCATVDAVVDYVSACPDEYDGGFAVNVELLDGRTLNPAWSVTIADAWFVMPIDADFSGDGRSDVMAFSEDAEGYVTTALAGADGTTLWSQTSPDDWAFPVATGDLDGTPGADMVTVVFTYGFGDADEAIVVERRRGRDGVVLSTTEHTMPPVPDEANGIGMLAYAAGAPDGDGDGFEDLTVGWVQAAYRFDEETGEEHLLSLRSGAVAESGATGAPRRTLDAVDRAQLLLPLDDVSGDSRSDLVIEDYGDLDSEGSDVTWTVLPFGPGPAAWTRSAGGDYTWLEAAGDQDGVAGNELLLQSYHYDDDSVWSSVTSVSGRTGRNRWTIDTR